MLKRILAVFGIIIILGWVIATFVMAVIPFPLKSVIFPIFAAGCVLLPIMLWLLLWMISVVTGKRNVATFEVEKNKNDEETVSKASQDGLDSPSESGEEKI